MEVHRAALRGGVRQRPVGCPVDGLAVHLEPGADPQQALLELRLDGPLRRRTDIQQEVAALAGDLNERTDQLRDRLVVAVVLVVGPGTVDGHASFPEPELLRRRDGLRDDLLGSLVVAVEADAVVDQAGGLQLANQLVKPAAVVLLLAAETVEPEDGHVPVSREQLGDLELHVVEVQRPFRPRGLAAPVLARRLRRIAEAGMVHVRRRVVKAERHRLGLGRRRQFRHDVLLVRRVGDLIVRVGRVEHREAVVVFGSEHHVALPGGLGQPHPGARVEPHRVEPLRQGAVVGFRDRRVALGARAHDRPRGLDAGQRIRPPVDEHAELGLAEPCRAVALACDRGRAVALAGARGGAVLGRQRGDRRKEQEQLLHRLNLTTT